MTRLKPRESAIQNLVTRIQFDDKIRDLLTERGIDTSPSRTAAQIAQDIKSLPEMEYLDLSAEVSKRDATEGFDHQQRQAEGVIALKRFAARVWNENMAEIVPRATMGLDQGVKAARAALEVNDQNEFASIMEGMNEDVRQMQDDLRVARQVMANQVLMQLRRHGDTFEVSARKGIASATIDDLPVPEKVAEYINAPSMLQREAVEAEVRRQATAEREAAQSASHRPSPAP